jgi:predicted nucleic acid-binding protein
VLLEVADGLAGSRHQYMFSKTRLLADENVEIVPLQIPLYEEALYAARLDKQWSLTDCLSFVVMQQKSLPRH